MLTFTLAISCLTTSNLPWFMGLTFQAPMQYCSLQHQTLLPSITSTTGYCFCLGSISSFFLELFLHWSPVTYWAPTDLRSSSFSVLCFCLFILFMEFWRQGYIYSLFIYVSFLSTWIDTKAQDFPEAERHAGQNDKVEGRKPSILEHTWYSLVAQTRKSLPAMGETRV